MNKGWILLIIFVVGASIGGCGKTTPLAEFKQLHRAEGDDMFGYRTQDKNVTSAADVVAKFGNPPRTQDLPRLFIRERKAYFYKAKDEFGNATQAALIFVNDCDKNAPDLKCYKLIAVQSVADGGKK